MARSGLVLLAAVAVGGLAASGLAQSRISMQDPGSNWRNPGFNGGPFLAVEVNGYNGQFGGPGGSTTSFLTFCIERSEHISLPQTSYTEISDRAMMGGPDGGGDPLPGDPISEITSILYQTFRNSGSIGSGIYAGVIGSGQADDGMSLQRAIWFSENELNGTETEWQNDLRAQNYYNWAASLAANTPGEDIGDVRVLRLWEFWDPINGYSGYRQDQLTIVPLPPAAWAGLSSLAGVMAIGYIRRRKQLS